MIIELEPSEAEYVYSKLRKMPYDEVSVIINKMAKTFKEHNEKIKKEEELKESGIQEKKGPLK